MFEGLKDKLGAFRVDVEEEAETVPTDVEPDEEPEDDEADLSLGRRARSLATGRVVVDADDLSDPLWELELALLESDVDVDVAGEITNRIEEELVGETRTVLERTGSIVEDALREALLDVLSVGQFDFNERIASIDPPVVIIFTGVNGVGKTTSIAKLARYLEAQGYDLVIANGDTYRAGANEQMREHADRLDIDLISHDQGGDPAAVIYDAKEYAIAHDRDIVLGDTAGRLHTSQGLMDQLGKIGRVVEPDLTIFADEAVAGQDAINRAKEFNAVIPIDGTILTKADADTSGGAALSIAHATGTPILFLGTGQGYDDLEPFDATEMVKRLLDD